MKIYAFIILICILFESPAQTNLNLEAIEKKMGWNLDETKTKVLGSTDENSVNILFTEKGELIDGNRKSPQLYYISKIDLITGDILWTISTGKIGFYKEFNNGKFIGISAERLKIKETEASYNLRTIKIIDSKNGKIKTEIFIKDIPNNSRIFDITVDNSNNIIIYYPVKEDIAGSPSADKGILTKFNEKGEEIWNFPLGKGFVTSGKICANSQNEILFYTEDLNIPFESRKHISGKFENTSVIGKITSEGDLISLKSIYEKHRIVGWENTPYFLLQVGNEVKLGTTMAKILFSPNSFDFTKKGIQILTFSNKLELQKTDYFFGFQNRVIKSHIYKNHLLITGKPREYILTANGKINISKNKDKVTIQCNLSTGESTYNYIAKNNQEVISPFFNYNWELLNGHNLLFSKSNSWKRIKLLKSFPGNTTGFDELFDYQKLADGFITLQQVGTSNSPLSRKKFLAKYNSQDSCLWRFFINSSVRKSEITDEGNSYLFTTSNSPNNSTIKYVNNEGKLIWSKDVKHTNLRSTCLLNTNDILILDGKKEFQFDSLKNLNIYLTLTKVTEKGILTKKKIYSTVDSRFRIHCIQKNWDHSFNVIIETTGLLSLENDSILSIVNKSNFNKQYSINISLEEGKVKYSIFNLNKEYRFCQRINLYYFGKDRREILQIEYDKPSEESQFNRNLIFFKDGKKKWEKYIEASKTLSIYQLDNTIYLAKFISLPEDSWKNKQRFFLVVEKINLKNGKIEEVYSTNHNICDYNVNLDVKWLLNDNELSLIIPVNIYNVAELKEQSYYSMGDRDFAILFLININNH